MSKNTNLSFLTDYITADITNGRIGINNPSPSYAFDVTGTARTSTSTYLATASGNVGIGTTTASSLLTLSQSAFNKTTLGDARVIRLENSDPTVQLNSRQEIGFGYSTAYQPVVIGHQITNNTDFTNGSFYIAVRSGTGNTAPIQALTVVPGGNVELTIPNATSQGIIFKDTGNTQRGKIVYDETPGTMTFGTMTGYSTILITNNSEKMRITSAGNVGIGSTTAGAQLTLAQNNPNAFAQTYLTFRNTAAGYGSWAIWKSDDNNLGFYYGVNTDTPSAGYNMKLQYNGTTEFQSRVLIGMSSAVGFRSDSQLQVNNCTILRSNDGYNGNPSAVIYSGNDQSGTMFVEFTSSGFSRIGSITRNGASNVSYNTGSDIRIKKNIIDAPTSLEKLNSIQVRSFDWVEDDAHQDFGFIAQELINVMPVAVTRGAKEKDIWQVDNSKLVPLLVKSIQELKAEIEILKQK